ncbi:MAG: hypothetical protein AB1611_05345 [bacterium]
MEKDKKYPLSAVSLSGPAAEQELFDKSTDSSVDSDNCLTQENQEQTEAQKIDTLHTCAQRKSAHILEEVVSRLVSDLKNKRFENKQTSGK